MKPCLLLLLIFLSALISRAGAQHIFFNKVLPPEGKNFIHVTGMTQDREGYMWLATKKGLFRYDGYQMVHYKNNPTDTNSLASDALETISVDSAGNIWIGTFGFGLDQFDPVTGIFKHFRHNPKVPESIGGDQINAILADHEGTLWVGNNGGLDRLDAKTGKFSHYRHNLNEPTSISYNGVVAIYEDRQGTLWIGTGSVYGSDGGKAELGGLNRLDKKTGKFTRYLHDPKNPFSLINNKVRAIFEDSKGNFWVGTAGDGLHIMDRKNGRFQRHLHDPAHPEKLSRPSISKLFGNNDHITFIKEDATGAIWIGTSESGLNYFDPQTQRIKHFESERDTAGAFTERTTWRAYTSREGVLWISTLFGTLYRINPLRRNIPFFETTNQAVNTFYEEPNGSLWIGKGNDGGLVHTLPGKGIVKQYVNNPGDTTTLSDNSVKIIKEDRQGRIWIGTYNGLNLWDKKRGIFTRFLHDPKNSNSLSDNFIFDIYEDRDANLWLATGRGLSLINKTGSFTNYIFYPSDTTEINMISSVLKNRQGQLWAGCIIGCGVYLFNKENGKFKVLLKGKSVIGLYEDESGAIWAYGNDGLYQYNRTKGEFIRFVHTGLPREISNVRFLIEDEQRNMWLGTPDGIIQFNRKLNEFRIFSSSYGVNGNNFVANSCYKGRNGKLYIGTYSGYFAYSPKQLLKGLRPPEIVISGFHLANQLIQPNINSVLSQPLSQTEEIKLRYNQDVFSFDFTSIDFFNPEDNRHFFMLENYDANWNRAGSDRRAIYFNVPSGKYIFRVKAANSNGIWAKKSINIIISPPWWRTWWANTLFALMCAGIIWGITYYRSRSLIKDKKRLEEKVSIRTAEVVKQKEEIAIQRDNLEKTLKELKGTQAQLIQKEKMASLGELTAGIAHEIQNPLNFVNNFSEISIELLHELKEEQGKHSRDAHLENEIINNIDQNLQKIVHHGHRADAIVKNMLQHSRVATGERLATDINSLADEYFRLSYHGIRAKDKSFNATLITNFDEHIGKVNVFPQGIGRVLLNLYNNAFYSVHEKSKRLNGAYQPTVSVSTKRSDNQIEISVKDNGFGIPQGVLDKIFQPFFTTKPTGEGTGLGLSLSYDIITKEHGGELKVETKEGEFSEFVVVLPV